VRVLQYHGNILSQFVTLVILDVNAVDCNFALVNIVKSVKQIGNGRFPCTGGAYKGNFLPRQRAERNMFKHRFFGNIAESNVIKNNIAFDVCHIFCIGNIGNFGVGIHNGKHPLRARKSRKYCAHLLGNHIYRH